MKPKSNNLRLRTIQKRAQNGRGRPVSAKDAVDVAFATVGGYLRDHPWIAVAGAAAISGAIGALAERKQMPGPVKNGKVVSKWVNDAYAKLPSQRQWQSMAKSAGLTDFLKKLKG